MTTNQKIIQNLKEEDLRLRRESLRLRLHCEVLSMHPRSKASEKILSRYARGFRTITFNLN